VPHWIIPLPLAAVYPALLCAALAMAPSTAAFAEPAAVTISAQGVLTICRNWILFRSCKPYDKIDLPPQVAVGDRITLSSFGSNPKDYVFHIVEIRQKGEGCLLLSDASHGREDRERIEVPRCEPVAKQAAEPR
jgi:hypothetical protein